jgi:hypothetical protein
MDLSTIKIPTYAKLALIIIGLIGFGYIPLCRTGNHHSFNVCCYYWYITKPCYELFSKKRNQSDCRDIARTFRDYHCRGRRWYYIGSQLAHFSDTLPQFKENFSGFQKEATDWASNTFGIQKPKIQGWITDAKAGLSSSSTIGKTIGALSGLLVIIILPVYTFLILYYTARILEFIERLFKRGEQDVVDEVLTETKALIQSYLVGLSIEAIIVDTMNSVALMIIGVQYAVLLGIIGGLLNLIPYLGGLIAIALPMLVAVATGSPIDALWVSLHTSWFNL